MMAPEPMASMAGSAAMDIGTFLARADLRRHRAVPRHQREQLCHAAPAGDAGKGKSCPDESRECIEFGCHELAEQNAEQHQASGRDEYLALDLDRTAAAMLDRQPGLLPGFDAALDHIGVTTCRPGQLVLVRCGALAGPAVEDGDPASPIQGRETFDGVVLGARNALARVLVRSADVDQPRALSDQA